MTPAPQSAPVIACVVETGRPVHDANSTQPIAPTATATRNSCPDGTVASRPLPLNALSNPCAAIVATNPPATVQTVPQTTARRKLVTPLPTSVAMPLLTSLAPLAN